MHECKHNLILGYVSKVFFQPLHLFVRNDHLVFVAVEAADCETFLVCYAFNVVQCYQMDVSDIEGIIIRTKVSAIVYECLLLVVVCNAVVVISDCLVDMQAAEALHFVLEFKEAEVIWNPILVVDHVAERDSVKEFSRAR